MTARLKVSFYICEFALVDIGHLLLISNMPTAVSIASDPEAMQPKSQASPFRHQISPPQQQVPPLTAQGGRGYRSQSRSHSESSDYLLQLVSTPKVQEYLSSSLQLSHNYIKLGTLYL